MSKRRKVEELQQRREEALQSPVNPSGTGEDPAVRDLLSGEMAKATDSEALDMAIALRQILHGQQTILQKQELQDEQIRILKQEAAERDAASKRFQEDQQKFLQEVMDRAEKLRVRGAELDSMKAEASREAANEYRMAMAKAKTDQMEFDQQLARMPKEIVVSGGVPLLTSENGRPVAKLEPEVIRIKHRTWRLPPGIPVEVPKVVAEALRARRQGNEQTRQMETALASDLEFDKLNQKLSEIRKGTEKPFDPSLIKVPLPSDMP